MMGESKKLDVELAVEPEEKDEFEIALEKVGFGKFNWLMIFVSGLCLFGVNSEAYSIGYVMARAQCDLNLTVYTKGILSSANSIGIMGSCIVWGYIADMKGRKSLLLFCSLCAFLTSAVACVAPSFLTFTILRFFNGIFIAGPSAVIFAYLSEFQSKKNYGKALSVASLFIALALLIPPGIGWILLPQTFNLNILGLNFTSWRMFVLINGIPNLIVGLALIKLPESPKYLYSTGRVKEAVEVLKYIYSVNKQDDAIDLKELEFSKQIDASEENTVSVFHKLYSQLKALFTPPHLVYSLSASFVLATAFATSAGLYLWYPHIINQLVKNTNDPRSTVCEILNAIENSTDDAAIECSSHLDQQVFLQNVIIGITYLGGYMLWGFLVPVLGNRNFVVYCMAIASVAVAAVSFVYDTTWTYVLFICFMVLPGITVAIVNGLVVNILPTQLCGTAVCIVGTFGRLGSTVASSVAGIMFQWNCIVAFMLYGISLIGSAFLMLIVFPKK